MALEVGDTWENPFTGENHQESIDQLLERAVRVCKDYLAYGLELLENPEKIADFPEKIGNRNYETGI